MKIPFRFLESNPNLSQVDLNSIYSEKNYLTELSKIQEPKLGRFVILKKDGALGETGLLGFLAAKIASLWNRDPNSDRTNKALIELRLLQTLEFGAKKGWIDKKNSELFDSLALRYGTLSTDSKSPGNIKNAVKDIFDVMGQTKEDNQRAVATARDRIRTYCVVHKLPIETPDEASSDSKEKSLIRSSSLQTLPASAQEEMLLIPESPEKDTNKNELSDTSSASEVAKDEKEEKPSITLPDNQSSAQKSSSGDVSDDLSKPNEELQPLNQTGTMVNTPENVSIPNTPETSSIIKNEKEPSDSQNDEVPETMQETAWRISDYFQSVFAGSLAAKNALYGWGAWLFGVGEEEDAEEILKEIGSQQNEEVFSSDDSVKTEKIEKEFSETSYQVAIPPSGIPNPVNRVTGRLINACYRNSSNQALKALPSFVEKLSKPITTGQDVKKRENIRKALVHLYKCLDAHQSKKVVGEAELALRHAVFQSELSADLQGKTHLDDQQDAAAYLELILGEVLGAHHKAMREYYIELDNVKVPHSKLLEKQAILQVAIKPGVPLDLQSQLDAHFADILNNDPENPIRLEGRSTPFTEYHEKTSFVEESNGFLAIQLKRGLYDEEEALKRIDEQISAWPAVSWMSDEDLLALRTALLEEAKQNPQINKKPLAFSPGNIITIDQVDAKGRVTKTLRYQLKSFVMHESAEFFSAGHYTAYGLKDGQWYFYDDAQVVPVSQEDVDEEKEKAYLFFFEQIDKDVKS